MSNLISSDRVRVTLSTRLAGGGFGVAALVLRKVLAAMERGRLIFILPDGARVDCRGPKPGPEATIVLHEMSALRRLLFSGDVAFAEAFVRGEWSSPDLAAAIEVAAVNGDAFMRAVEGFAPARFANWLAHRLRANSKHGSRRNIAAHYDLGNAFYRLWLDPSMFYSSGLYRTGAETLEESQQNKVDRILELLDAESGESVLEIGCGWGGLALFAARTYGCRVTGITVSEEQFGLATTRVHAEGLQHLVDIRLCDYRDVQGQFSHVVSIEMLEAVGREHWPTFFAVCDARLARGGAIAIQTIAMPDHRFETYARHADWIQKYIFPGGMLPSIGEMLKAAAADTPLTLRWVDDVAPHYARTLREWRLRFFDRLDEVRALGFDDRFIRMWEYYLALSEAGFATGISQDLQIVFEKGRGLG
jgi:cyclopropane-fatty-acyl-phospholipid synthase